MRLPLSILVVFGAAIGMAAQPELSDVFLAGKDGFKSIRIPSVVVTKNGVVLAIAEGRAQHADQANNKLILKRSRDGGRTWGAQRIIADDGANTLNNPCSVADERSGRVIVMYQSYPAGFSERDGGIQPGLEGAAIVRNYVVHSDDEGVTWSKPEDVTRTTKTAERVTILASGPGIGIQLRRGPHTGRILIPFNEGPFGHWNVLAVYSDDGGATWRQGQPAPRCNVPDGKGGEISLVNEVQMVELGDGSVKLNSRKWGGKPLRKVAVSQDGGMTWSTVEEDAALRDPGCMASILRCSFLGKNSESRILYSGPDSTKRDTGTIYLSRDEGKTWPVKKVLFPGSFSYSVLTALPDGTIGCLFETDSANRIVFARFTIDWLLEPSTLKPNRVFNHHAVLQRGQPCPVFGVDLPGTPVRVTFANQSLTNVADLNGDWRVNLAPLELNALPQTLTITGSGTLSFTNILVGDVWLISGQSNADFPLSAAIGGREAITSATNQWIRYLHLAECPRTDAVTWSPDDVARLRPDRYCSGTWQVNNPVSAGEVSAVGYFFARHLVAHQSVPIGLVDCTVGGTPALSWMPTEAIGAEPRLKVVAEHYLDSDEVPAFVKKRLLRNLADWDVAGRPAPMPEHPYIPGACWRNALGTIVPFALRGILWYQGETDADFSEPRDFGRMARLHIGTFQSLVTAWRAAWQRPELPVYFVQLPRMNRPSWPWFRESQSRCAQTVPHTAMAVSFDCGDANNVHPANKRPVAERLALLARQDSYGEPVEASGPALSRWDVQDGKLLLHFHHATGGLVASDGNPLRLFEIAGTNRQFFSASAVVSNTTLIVSAPEVSVPVAARYAWSPTGSVNFYNGAGLPAAPFRTDDWPATQ